MSTYDAVDQFAGPGGWDIAAAMLGIRTVGIEKDRDACATARAAGHVRVRRDLAELDPEPWRASCRGLISSPPCQAWSKAGKRLGLKDQPRLLAHLDAIQRAGEWIDHGTDGWHDEKSPLVLQPLRWALTLRPEWIALEQVPDVLPFWERLAEVLRSVGYQVWTGVLDAEMYGVPQTRDRAILTASRVGHQASRPPATHHRFRAGHVPVPSLFDDLLPWVSMADALGWNGGAYHLARGTGMNERHGDRPDTSMDRPAPVITSKARTASWVFTNNDSRTAGGGKERFRRTTDAPSPGVTGSVGRWSVRFGNQPHSAVRSADHPAATTLRYGERMNACDWVMCAAGATSPESAGTRPRSTDEPSATLTGKGTAAWVNDRPATTVQGDPRIAEPGHRDRAGGVSQFAGNSVRVSVEEAACLQSVPAGYPWQGSRTSQYQQIGNMIPPLLAVAVLGHLLDVDGWADICRGAFASEAVA